MSFVIALKVALIAVASWAYRQRGMPNKVDWTKVYVFRDFVPDYPTPATAKLPKFIALVTCGGAIALIILGTYSPIPFIIMGLGLAAGFSLKLGNAVGPFFHDEKPDVNRLAWYQVGPAENSAVLSLIILGVLRGVPTLLVGAYNMAYLPYAVVLVAATTAATLLAPAIAVFVFDGYLTRPQGGTKQWALESIRSDDMWAAHEYIFGALMGAMALVGTFVL